MRDGFTQRHRRDKEFVLDLSGFKDHPLLSPREIEQMLNEQHPIYDRGAHGKRVGHMTVRQFLEKFG